MRYSVAYDKALEISKDMGDSLFQRLNFFLIGTAFLIAGLAALVAGSNSTELTGHPLALAYTINAVGLYLALFFTLVNFLNIEILADFGEYIRELEQELMAGRGDLPITEAPPSTRAEEIVDSMMAGFPWGLARRLLDRIYGLLTTPEDRATRGITQHVWVVPVIFVAAWLTIFFLVLPLRWDAAVVVFGLLALVPMWYARHHLKSAWDSSLRKTPRMLAGMKRK